MPAFPSTRLARRELIVPDLTDFRTRARDRRDRAASAARSPGGSRPTGSRLAAGRRDGDLADPSAAAELVERAAAELGRLDLVVHAASDGFAPRSVAEVTEEDWDAAFGATAKGSFFVAQAAAPHLRRSELGLLVLIEDVAGTSPGRSFAPHCAAKAAQAMLTRVLARALAPEVRVCGIAPGPWPSSRSRKSDGRPRRSSAGRHPGRRRRGGRSTSSRALRHRHVAHGRRRAASARRNQKTTCETGLR